MTAFDLLFFSAFHEFLQTRHEISRPCQCSSVWRQPAVMDCAVPVPEVVPKTITKTPERPARLRYRAAIRRTRCLIRACYKDRDRQKMSGNGLHLTSREKDLEKQQVKI